MSELVWYHVSFTVSRLFLTQRVTTQTSFSALALKTASLNGYTRPLGISHHSLINVKVDTKRKVSLHAHFIRQSFRTSKLTIISEIPTLWKLPFFKSRASTAAPISSFLNGYFMVWKVLFHRKYQQKSNSQKSNSFP